MVRFTRLVTSTLSICLVAAAAAACNTASDDANKAKAAQATANDKSGAAVRESDEKVENAQAEADKKIGAARADFMTMRENFRHATTQNLVDLDQKVDALSTKANQSSGKEKTDRDAGLKQIHASRDAFQKLFLSLDSASESTWDDAKARVDKEWTDLKTMVDRA
jgi:tetrahydromethanopterin S-methyltransferase subunit G